jgi:Zn-dependent metalloprotease
MNKVGLMALAPALFGCTGLPAETSTSFQVDQIEVARDGSPYFLRGALGQVTAPMIDSAGAQAALAGVLPAIAETLGVPAADLVAVRAERDELGMTHVRMAQHKNGLRVVGGDVIVHVDADGVVRTVNGTPRDRALTAVPSLAALDAAQIAVQATEEPVDAVGSELTYVVSNRDGELYLAWEVAVTGRGALVEDLVYVDALTGSVVDRHPQLFTIKNRTISNGAGGVFPVAAAAVIGTEATAPTDPVALAAFTNTGITYDCYKALYNRDSYNGLGATLASQVHVVFPTGVGAQTSPNNAVWSSSQKMMAYGDGDNVQMRPLAYALDVTAHELTHAVTSSTADLIYQNESGALNEALSDIMAAVCEAWQAKAVTPNTWLVGEDIWTPGTAGDALRYMSDPLKDGSSPDYYPERFVGTADNGGVHRNSGMPNLAFYLLSAGGKHPRAKTATTVPAIGIDKAGAIFQRALTTKFTTNTNLAQARTLTEQAAQELFPGTCAPLAVGLAWAAVGVGGAAPADAVPPTVAITSPAPGARVQAGFQVQVTSTDNQCINKVELVIDGAVAQTLTAAPYTFTTSAALASGMHTLEVRSYDAVNKATATAVISLSGGGNGAGPGTGLGTDGGDNDLTGGCSAGGSGSGGAATGGLLLCLALVLRRRR